MRTRTALAALVVTVGVVLATLGMPYAAAAAAPAVAVPPDQTVSYVVYDRIAHRLVAQRNPHQRFRSASLVKLLIALDYLQTRGSASNIPPADAALLRSMLRSSDDDAASQLWVRGGYEQVITRTVRKLGLVDTSPPADRGIWGYTAISASDIVTIYNYILDRAPRSYRDFIIGNLEQSTRCGADGFDQSFGLPRAVAGRKAVKQGWSGFGASPTGPPCVERPVRPDPPAGPPMPTPAQGTGVAGPATPPGSVDLTRPAMHTSGLVDDQRRVMVVLTLVPVGTTFGASSDSITRITRQLHDEAVAASPGPPGPPPYGG